MEAGEPAPAPTQASSSSTEPAPAPAVDKAAYRQTEAEEAAGHQLRLVGGGRGVMMDADEQLGISSAWLGVGEGIETL